MAAISLAIYEGEYGNTIRAYTRSKKINDATQIRLLFWTDDGDTASLTAATVEGDTTYYAVDATVTEGWTTGKVGRWTGVVEATFFDGLLYGTRFTLYIKDMPAT